MFLKFFSYTSFLNDLYKNIAASAVLSYALALDVGHFFIRCLICVAGKLSFFLYIHNHHDL